jgi:hypothetical protein
MSLCKYFPPDRGFEALSERKLMVTPPKYFNDPFDFSPIIRCQDPAAYALRLFDDATSSPNYFNAHRANFPMVSDFAKFREYSNRPTVKTAVLAKLAKGVTETDLRTQNAVVDVMSQSFGVICFAGDAVHPLMWGHYTSRHSGLVIEFREDDLLFTPPSFLRVDYLDERVIYDASGVPDRATVELFARRKSSHWAYERESRLIVPLADAVPFDAPDGVRYFFLPIEPRLIVSVTLGLRADDELKNKVIEALSAPELRHVELFQIAKDENKFEFHRRPVDVTAR